eukprot:924737-Rhodomonas_salina.4
MCGGGVPPRLSDAFAMFDTDVLGPPQVFDPFYLLISALITVGQVAVWKCGMRYAVLRCIVPLPATRILHRCGMLQVR